MLNYMEFKYTVFVLIPIFLTGNFLLKKPIHNLERVVGCPEPEAAIINDYVFII